MSLIDDILAASSRRLAARQRAVPLPEIMRIAADAPRARVGLREVLAAAPFSLIAEEKAKSPSSGAMDPANVAAAVAVYDATPSVAAISVLTDEDYFDGSLDRLRLARTLTTKPLLRKDFVVDPYQVWEARACGADAVLLMADLYRDAPARLAEMFELVRRLGMDALFELGMRTVTDPASVIPGEAQVWGINSRRFNTSRLQARATLGRLLGTELSIDSDAHATLRAQIPEGRIAIAESGIHDPADVRKIAGLGYSAALIGTAFLKRGVKVADVVRSFDEEVARLVRAPQRGPRPSPHPVPSGG